ncbi:MAG: hypothetical protein ACE5K0_03380 [Candidatus Methanofastidiosia archaeon]
MIDEIELHNMRKDFRMTILGICTYSFLASILLIYGMLERPLLILPFIFSILGFVVLFKKISEFYQKVYFRNLS